MTLPLIEAAWAHWLEGTTEVAYPTAPGDVRISLLSVTQIVRTIYDASILVELWADRATSDADAVALHARSRAIDSAPDALAHFTRVTADGPVLHPDPDSRDLDRYQFMVSFRVRTR